MPPHVLPTRGLADLRTLAGRADRRTLSYKEYLRVSFLELERARHAQEIATARRRLELMLARCREIEAEKAAILGAAAAPAATAAHERRATTAGRVASRPSGGPFRFSY